MAQSMFDWLKSRLLYRTIKLDFMVVFLLFVVTPTLIVNLFYFSRINQYIEDKVKIYNEEILNQLGSKLEFMLVQVDIMEKQMLSTLIYSQVFVEYGKKTPAEKVDSVQKAEAVLKNIRMGFSNIFDVYLIGNDGNVYSSNYYFDKAVLMDQTWLQEIYDSKESQLVVPTHYADYASLSTNKSKPVVTFLKKSILNIENSMSGIVQVDLKYEALKQLIENTDYGENLFTLVTDADNRVIYAQDERYLGEPMGFVRYEGHPMSSYFGERPANRSFLTIQTKLQDSGWKLYAIAPKEGIFKEIARVKKVSVLIGMLSVVTCFLVFYFLSRNLIAPITRLIRSMRRVGEGRLDVAVPEVRNRDLQVLSSTFNGMVNRIQSLVANVIDKEKEKTRSELLALQAQINPHFLYNTLNTIKWMAYMEKSEPIAGAIVSLVNVLKFSSRDSDKLILISDELEFIDSYIAILKLRYGNLIQFRIEVEEEIRKLYILKFVLQPILENAVLHGLSKRNYEGNVVLRGRAESGSVLFEIEDDGGGMRPVDNEKMTGLGIHNVLSRLKLNFGERYGLNIDSEPDRGTKVILTLPRITEEEKDGYE